MSNFSRYVKNTLQDAALPASDSAVELLVMIAAHESGGFQFVRQIKGSALGLYQMENPALLDVQRYIAVKPRSLGHLQDYTTVPFEFLNYDQQFATVAARIYLMMKPERLPEFDDVEGMGVYAKKYWNTSLGKATAHKYASDYQLYS